MTDTSDLVEQLLEKANWRNDVHGELHRKAAAALTAKDKEIEAVRERLKAATQSRDTFAKWGREAMTRAETAERERDEARAALATAEQMISEHIEEFHDFDYAPHDIPRELSQLQGIQHHLLGSLTDENGEPFAARAVIKQGE